MEILEKLLLVKEMTIQLIAQNYSNRTMDLSKHQALDANPKAIQQINFTANLDREGKKKILFYS